MTERQYNWRPGRVLVGNWYEDLVLQDEKLRAFLERKERGGLTIQKIRQNLASIRVTPQPAGTGVKYGEPLFIQNVGTSLYLSCDPFDPENIEEQLYTATATAEREPTSRNVWIVQNAQGPFEGLVKFGDIVTLQTTGPNPFYLGSQAKDWKHESRISRKTMIYSSQKEHVFNNWIVLPLGKFALDDWEGEDVQFGDKFMLHHVSTNLPLCVSNCEIVNDYGKERELIGEKIATYQIVWTFPSE
uniref:Uncharacterized protein n=1 Tax=Coptotermes formosanus TaxID=36987 RepID=R4V2W6_COPFO|nr:hypothetical protein [Coptotermes formosanus]